MVVLRSVNMKKQRDILNELEALGSSLATQNIENVYVVPDGYFEGLAEAVMARIRQHADYQNSREELESLSPLLSSLKKETPYSVPAGYFSQEVRIPAAGTGSKPAKVVSFSSRIMRYAVAAVITGALVLGGLRLLNNGTKTADPETAIAKKLGKDIKNHEISKEDVDDFLDLTEAIAAVDAKQEPVTGTESTNLKDVSDKELLDFMEVLPDEMN